MPPTLTFARPRTISEQQIDILAEALNETLERFT
jgi:hypothetical protein